MLNVLSMHACMHSSIKTVQYDRSTIQPEAACKAHRTELRARIPIISAGCFLMSLGICKDEERKTSSSPRDEEERTRDKKKLVYHKIIYTRMYNVDDVDTRLAIN
jgi:hypothetical protein